jgi:hypothetical protein
LPINLNSRLVAAESAGYRLRVVISMSPKLYFVICEYAMTFHTGTVSGAALKAEGNDVKV